MVGELFLTLIFIDFGLRFFQVYFEQTRKERNDKEEHEDNDVDISIDETGEEKIFDNFTRV